VCRSVLHISQDPIQGNGQRKKAFWDRIAMHCNQNRPAGGNQRPSRSLETKWGVIKHDIAKFIGVYNQVLGCRESGTSLDDVLQNALELYKVKHPKQHSFLFIHCWLVLKDVPCWMEMPSEVRQHAVARASAAGIGARRRSTPPLPMRQDIGSPTAVPLVSDKEDADIGVEEPMQRSVPQARPSRADHVGRSLRRKSNACKNSESTQLGHRRVQRPTWLRPISRKPKFYKTRWLFLCSRCPRVPSCL
jgi:hypothetical protein